MGLPPLGAALDPPGPRCGVFPLSTVASNLGHVTHPVYHPHPSQQPLEMPLQECWGEWGG